MASYPEPLQFITKSLNGWSVNTARVTPTTLQVADPTDILQWTLPENTLVDLSTLAIMFDVQGLRGGGANDQCVLPRHSTSFIDMVSVSINGVSVDSSMVGYGHLAKMLKDFGEGARKDADGVLHLGKDYASTNTALPLVGVSKATGNGGVAAFTTSVITDQVNSGRNATPVCISDWYGFCGLPKILDTSLLGIVTLSIRLAPATITTNLSGGASPSYRVFNARMFVNTCDVSDGLYYNSINARLQSAPLAINFKKFYSFSGPPVTGSTSIRFSVASQSIDAVYGILLPQTISRVAPTAENAVTPYFRRLSTKAASPGNSDFIQSWQFDMSSVQYPSWQASIAEGYYMLLNTLRGFKEKSRSFINMIDYDQWTEDLFVASYRWSFGGPHDLEYKSGLDSRGVSTSGSFNLVSPGTLDALPLIIVETTATLSVGAYRSISLTN